MVDIEVKKNKNLSSHFIEKFVRILPGNYKLFMDENLHFIYISTSAELNGSIGYIKNKFFNFRAGRWECKYEM